MNQKNDQKIKKDAKRTKRLPLQYGASLSAQLILAFWCVSYGTWYFKRYIKFWPKKGRTKK